MPVLADLAKRPQKLALFFSLPRTLYLFFINKSGTKTVSRLSGLTVKNFSQIGLVVFPVGAVVEKPLQYYILV